MTAAVTAVHRKTGHAFSKDTVDAIELVAGQGVRDDGHCGATVQHRSRVARDPTRPNLRQVHLIQEALLAELQGLGFSVLPGQLGENVTTRGIDLLGLGAGTQLQFGDQAVIEVTGLRNPCSQIEDFRPGLLSAVLGRAPDGAPVRKAGVMAVVVRGGRVKAGDRVRVLQAPTPFRALEPV